MPANHFTLEASPAVTKYEDEPIYGGEAYVRVVYDPNLAGSLTFSVRDLPPGISYDPTTGEFSGAALRSAVPRGGSPVTYNATITVSDGTATESAIVPFTILDNTFSMETPDTQISHPGEAVFFAPTLSYTQSNFSGSLMFSYENLPSGLSFDSLYGTVEGTIDANLVTPESNIRDYTVVLTVSDPVTGDQQQVSFQWRVETDPYPAYVSRLEQAKAIYISAVEQALSERASAWQTALANAQVEADAAYSGYLAAWQAAVANYNAAVQDADSAYDDAIRQADGAYSQAEQEAHEQLQQELAQIQSAYDSRVQTIEDDYQADILAADAAYNNYITPYQQARDQAYAYWQEHPEDWDAYQNYVQAQSNLDNAISQASQEREQAYATAAARRDLRLQQAWQELESQEADAYAAYYAAVDSAAEAWASAVEGAYNAWKSAIDAAEIAYEQEEGQAWTRYLDSLAIINANLEQSRLDLESRFAVAVSNATTQWRDSESVAWQSYQSARAGMLQPPPEGVRAPAPPQMAGIAPLVPCLLLAGPAGAKPAADPTDEKHVSPLKEQALREQHLARTLITDMALRDKAGGKYYAKGSLRISDGDMITADKVGYGNLLTAQQKVDAAFASACGEAGWTYKGSTLREGRVDWTVTNPAGSPGAAKPANVEGTVVYWLEATFVDPTGRTVVKRYGIPVTRDLKAIQVIIRGHAGNEFDPTLPANK